HTNVDMQAASDGMEPETGAVGDDRKLRWAIRPNASIRFLVLEQLADMDVQMALRAPGIAVHRDPPGIAPKFLCFTDRSSPESQALFSGHSGQGIWAVGLPGACQGEP